MTQKGFWDIFGQHTAEYGEHRGDYPCRCRISDNNSSVCDTNDEWCKSGPGRYTHRYDNPNTYYPKLRLCVGVDMGGNLRIDEKEADGEAVKIIVK